MPAAPALEFLFSLTADIALAGLLAGAPAGDRVVMAAPTGHFAGPRLRGTLKGPGGDWVTRRRDGSSTLDVRLLLETDDAEVILMTYRGIALDGGKCIRIAPLFETGAASYSWLNTVQAVGTGSTGPGSVTYDVFSC